MAREPQVGVRVLGRDVKVDVQCRMIVVFFRGNFVLETGEIAFVRFARVAVANGCPHVRYPGATTRKENVVLLSTLKLEWEG